MLIISPRKMEERMYTKQLGCWKKSGVYHALFLLTIFTKLLTIKASNCKKNFNALNHLMI